MLSLLAEERQWPAFTKCLGREDLRDDPRFATKPDRHARSVELIRILDEVFATRDLADWRERLDGNGLVFGFVGILDDIPNDQQMKDNDVLIPFEGTDILTINSPIWIGGETKRKPHLPPSIGQHSDEILRAAGFNDADIARLRASGTVA
jgi:crotonobetainyl-CoA:carnitine CoA-transferase CaiB-like acyl-CoA transferase